MIRRNIYKKGSRTNHLLRQNGWVGIAKHKVMLTLYMDGHISIKMMKLQHSAI